MSRRGHAVRHPLCPAGHLPHKEGDRQKVGLPVPLQRRAEHQFVIAWGNHRAQPISPPAGRCPAGQREAPHGTPQLSLITPLQLLLIGPSHPRELLRGLLQLPVRAPVAAFVSGRAGVIGEIEIISIVQRNAGLGAVLGVVPADEIDRVGEVRPPRRPVPGLRLIMVPRSVERLRIAVGGRRPRPGNEAEQFGAGRPRVGLEAGSSPSGSAPARRISSPSARPHSASWRKVRRARRRRRRCSASASAPSRSRRAARDPQRSERYEYA